MEQVSVRQARIGTRQILTKESRFLPKQLKFSSGLETFKVNGSL